MINTLTALIWVDVSIACESCSCSTWRNGHVSMHVFSVSNSKILIGIGRRVCVCVYGKVKRSHFNYYFYLIPTKSIVDMLCFYKMLILTNKNIIWINLQVRRAHRAHICIMYLCQLCFIGAIFVARHFPHFFLARSFAMCLRCAHNNSWIRFHLLIIYRCRIGRRDGTYVRVIDTCVEL